MKTLGTKVVGENMVFAASEDRNDPFLVISYYWGKGAKLREPFMLRLTEDEARALSDGIRLWLAGLEAAR